MVVNISPARLQRAWRSPLDPKSAGFRPSKTQVWIKQSVKNTVQATTTGLRTAQVRESHLLTRHYHPRNVGILRTRHVHLSPQRIWKTRREYGMKEHNKSTDVRGLCTVVTVNCEYSLTADLNGNKAQTTKTYFEICAVQI